MKSILMLLLVPLALMAASCNSSTDYTVSSPDGTITMKVSLSDTFCYSVEFQGAELIRNASLGFILEDGPAFTRNLKCRDQNKKIVNETFQLPFGKRKIIRNIYNSLDVSLQEKNHLRRNIQLEIRAFDDAVAFRYQFPEQEGTDTIKIMEESTHFLFPTNPTAWFLSWPDYANNYEGLFKKSTLMEAPASLISLPVLMEFSDSVWMALTEANLENYAGMYLNKVQGNHPGLVSCLPPYPGKNGIKVVAQPGSYTPWRVIMLGDKPGTLMESDVIICLSDPSRVEDVSWIKPGKSTWHWWNGTVLENVGFKPGMNYETMKHYIDFCARNGIEYHSLVEAGGEFWYQNPDHSGWNPGITADVTAPLPELQMEKLIAYAREKGVGLRLWVHWKALNLKMEEAFKQYHDWGISGLMVDFMDRDDQEMVQFYHRCLELAARYELHIQFHGAYKPTGMNRTYPNLFTTEAALNTEWFGTCNPEHNVTVPFTRMLAGPMDYHLGGFHSVRKQDRARVGQVWGTRCHNMAMYVVYEGYLQLICDYPEAYEGQTGFEFLKQVPTTWDDMKVINGKVGDYITVARRSGGDWYIGSMTDWTGRELKIPLDFLPDGTFQAEIYEDAEDCDQNPNNLIYKVIEITNKDTLTAGLASGGGQAVYIRRK